MAEDNRTPEEIKKQKARDKTRAWRAKNPERDWEIQKKHEGKRREIRKEKLRIERDENPEIRKLANVKAKAWRAKNLQKELERCKKRYADNKEREREKARKWRLLNPDKVREAERKWKALNGAAFKEKYRERYRELHKEWMKRDRELHPEKQRHHIRARLRGAEGTHTANDIIQIFTLQGGKCAACKVLFPVTGKHRYHVDHVYPLSRGGIRQGRKHSTFM